MKINSVLMIWRMVGSTRIHRYWPLLGRLKSAVLCWKVGNLLASKELVVCWHNVCLRSCNNQQFQDENQLIRCWKFSVWLHKLSVHWHEVSNYCNNKFQAWHWQQVGGLVAGSLATKVGAFWGILVTVWWQ